ncbi:hypothetical protein P7C70_g6360, partial [Phenoliferia sp. Uapishka_3]
MSTTIGFVGATGGCALACLVKCLQTGVHCRALVRTPDKLTSLLLAEVDKKTINEHLTIIPGNAKDESAVAKMLHTHAGDFVGKIVFGVGELTSPILAHLFSSTELSGQSSGAAPKIKHLQLALDDPTVCADSMKTLLSAIKSLSFSTPPSLCFISTTGLNSATRDVPYLLKPVYACLKVPHIDKKNMETLVVATGDTLKGYVIVRPTLLSDGAERGAGKLKVGYGAGSPEIGYLVSRKDVGAWIFREFVMGSIGKESATEVTLTY